jgi:beta-lactam-binding protein with PASTA domain
MRVRQTHFREIFFRASQDLLILVTLGLVFILSTAIMLYAAMHKPTVTVPNVVGRQLGQAQGIAHEAGLDMEVKGRVYNNSAEADTVVEQWPRPGMMVKKGQTLRVSVSLGPDLGQMNSKR